MFKPVNQKQSFPELEENILNFWKQNQTFEKSVETRPEEKPYRFYDGPPFITGMPHYGHLLASTIKDIVPRYQTMQGKRVERVWGWDCHGIAVEEKVMKKLGLNSNREIEEKIGVEKFIEECYTYTKEISGEWEWYIDHIGRWVDLKNAYKTMDKKYMESVMWTFKQMYDKGLVYKGKRISFYSVKLGTPISNFEVAMDDSYEEVKDPAVTIKFKLKNGFDNFDNVSLLAWTTTPWTLPANIAIGVNKENDYVLVNFEGEKYILAKNRAETVFKGKGEYETIKEFKGSELVGLSYEPLFPFYVGIAPEDKNFKVYHADFITDTDGTGIGHEAPEFGEVDFQLGKENGLFETESIDDEAKYNDQVPDYKGIYVKDANELIMERLKTEGKLFKKESITHRVAVCPRTQIPLIYRTQDAWFLDIQNMKDKLLRENQNINWYPEHLKNGRFAKNIETAPDWCLSRKRYWATPVPMWTCKDCGENHIFGSIEEIEKAGGVKIDDLHKPYVDKIEIKCQKCGGVAKRIPEVLDVWLESGSMSLSQFHYPFENKDNFEKAYPADFIVEYIGQIRAWFYVMHVVGVTLFDKNAFKNVITTGVIAGNDGRKMSKSFGNFTDPKILLTKYGGDATRFYMASSPVVKGEDMNFNDVGVEEVVKKVILPLWNTYSFFTTYANIDKFEPENNGNIFYVRHGETDNNKNGIMNGGEEDTPLNGTGELQALEAGEKFALSGNKIDKIYVSPKLRTKKTAELIVSKLGYEVEIVEDERITEAYFGKFAGMKHDEIKQKYNLKSDYELRVLYRESNGKENIDQFNNRVWDFYNEIETERGTGKNILIVSHGGVFRSINQYLNNLTKEEANFECDVCSNGIIYKLPNYKKVNPLDKWIISELNNLNFELKNALDNYRLNEGAKPIMKFIDNLTNWYVRRSRKRFWGGGMSEDKLSAYNTLYEVLVETSKLIAPYMPFISEYIFQNLTGKESVHLELYPEANKAFIFEKLNESTAETQEVITLGLAARANAKIRVRQPLSYVKISHKLEEYYENIIKEELNVKEIKVFEENELPKQICKPNARLIGPKFGSDVKFIISEAKAGNFEEIEGGKVKVGEFILEPGEFEIEFLASESSKNENEIIESGNGIVVALDKHITEELKQEGYVRDIVRQIQESRKEANYNVDDRIEIELKVESGKLKVESKNIEYIERETLSKIVGNLESFDLEKEVDLDDFKVVLRLKR